MTGVPALAFSILWMAASTANVVVVTLPAKNDVVAPLGPSGHVDFKRDGAQTRVRVEFDRIPPVSTLGPGLTVYVVWAVSPEGVLENLGELTMDKDKGRLESISKFDQIGILITGEPHYMVDRPNSAVAYVTQNPKAADVRRLSETIPTGAYDYSKVQLPMQPAPELVQQARAAFQVAKLADGDRWAEAEFRRAQVAIDSLEEMLPRSVPPDILAQAANETIRSSQQAATAARLKAEAAAMQSAKDEAAVLKQEKQDLTVKVERLTEDELAANSQVQKLQNDLAAARKENQRLTTEGEQALNRANRSERELSDLKKKQGELESRLVVQLKDEFFDTKGSALTALGRETLMHLAGMADAVPGPVHIQGPAPDPLYEAARQFLIGVGITPDRIVIIRP